MGNASAFEMDALDTRIRELVAYARERDGEDRTLLFRNLVDLFLTGKAPLKEPTRTQLLDVIEALVPHVEPDGRRTVAELVANMSDPPLDLACRLAKDRPHLVGDLLKSTAFDESDIIELIECTGRDHHHVIASRNDLSANVWIALARAAPAAPPFDNQSTLALWRDDLGVMRDLEENPTVMPFRKNASMPDIPGTIPDNNLSAEGIGWAQDEKAAETKDPSKDQRHAAQLRILRTDKDLIADRLVKNSEPMQTLPENKEESRSAHISTAPASPPKPPEVMELIQNTDNVVAPAPHKDNWVWRSDRDGLVTEVSPEAYSLYSADFKLIGGTILDMLGLNTKLGHPVSRAFQRRSAIHDAPLTLTSKDNKNRFWTLEAKPLFSSNGGVFEGYWGRMTPVNSNDISSAVDHDAEPPNSSTEPSDVFFEGDAAHSLPAAGLDTITDETIDRTIVPAPIPERPAKVEPAVPSGKSLGNEVADIAATMIKDLVSESVAKALGELGPALNNKAAETVPAKEVEEGLPRQPIPTKNEDVAATLHILEQALSTMVISGQTANNSTLRLQTEIATACLKTLKEQMGAAGDNSDKS